MFRSTVEVSAADLETTNVLIHFGMIDDDGWVYVNGKFVGEAHDWSQPQNFSIGKFLRPGRNSLAVVVKNNANSGGLNKGADLQIEVKPQPVKWQRSVFNGLAQLLVQTTKQAGTLEATATGDGLQEAKVTLQAEPCTPRPEVP